MLKCLFIFMSACLSVCLSEVKVKSEVKSEREMLGTLIPNNSKGKLSIPFSVFYDDLDVSGTVDKLKKIQKAGYKTKDKAEDKDIKEGDKVESETSLRDVFSEIGSSFKNPLVFMTYAQQNNSKNSSSLTGLYSFLGGFLGGFLGNGYFVEKNTNGFYRQEIYLTDLKYRGYNDLDLQTNPPKMILKFEIEGWGLDYGEITLKEILISNNLESSQVADMINTISLQILGLYQGWSKTKPRVMHLYQDLLDHLLERNRLTKDSWESIKTSISNSSVIDKDLLIREIDKKIEEIEKLDVVFKEGKEKAFSRPAEFVGFILLSVGATAAIVGTIILFLCLAAML